MDEDILLSGTKNEGNVASTSTKYGEITINWVSLNEVDNYYWNCDVLSCDDCEILNKRIPGAYFFE